MLTSATTLVERRRVLTDDLGTHPYEAGWATEALFFVRADEEHPGLTVRAQVSPDGIDWVDHGPEIVIAAGAPLGRISMAQFGTWIRLFITGATADQPATVFVHLSLKG